ncbi:hypothetical protein REPUB_Repub09cG0202600 [Reevesia pubescens]
MRQDGGLLEPPRVEKKRQGLVPIRNVNLQEYLTFKEDKLGPLNPVVLDKPSGFPVKKNEEESQEAEMNLSTSGERVAPKNPRWAVYGRGFEDVAELFNSENYPLADKKIRRREPYLAVATFGKWLPLYTLAASGEFYLVDTLLKHNVDINAVDKDGATSMHYAVNAASTPTIKLLLLYKVDISLQDNIMLGSQLCLRTVSSFWIFSDQSNAAYPTHSSSSFRSSSFHSSIRLHFTIKRRRPSPKPILISCHSTHGSFGPQSSNDDNQDHQFLEASLLVSETILHYRMLRQGFEEDIKWKSSRRQLPMSRPKITSIGKDFLGRFPSPTIFLKISCDGDFLLPIIVGDFAVEKLISAFWGDDNGDSPDQFHLVKNVVEKLGYEVKMVRITERVVNTYFAKLYFSKPGENDVISVDARPSDAISVANRCKAPIYVNKQIVLADAIRIGYGMGRVRDTKSTYDVSLDSAAEGPDLLTEELDLVRNMDLALKEESNDKRQTNEATQLKSWPWRDIPSGFGVLACLDCLVRTASGRCKAKYSPERKPWKLEPVNPIKT